MKTTVFVKCSTKDLDVNIMDNMDQYCEFQVQTISLTESTIYAQQFTIDLPEIMPLGLFVTVVRYTEGSDHSHQFGMGSVEGVFLTRQEALDRATAIRNGAKSVVPGVSWTGFRDRLEGVEVHLVAIV